MKIVKIIFTFIVVIALFGSCEKAPTSIDDSTPCFVGTVVVDNDGEEFVQSNIEVYAEYDKGRGVVDIKMKKVRFASAMPRLDITIPGCPAVVSTGGGSEDELGNAMLEESKAGDIMFSGEGIVPYAVGQKYEKYTVTALKGKISGDVISYTLKFGKYPVSYEGTMRK